MKSQEAPPLSGPSEFAQSITVSVSPDVLPQDGASQSLVTVTARDVNSQPIRNLQLRTETVVFGTPMDFGTLSARSVVTGNDGRATFVYTAPPSPSITPDEFLIVDIVVTPIGSDFNNTTRRTAAIRLVPPGVVFPPDTLQPAFTFTPTSPTDNQTVLFDASTSQGAIADYQWDFGDGGRSSGRVTQHAYRAAGTYVVRLTISDGVGRTATATQSINVSGGVNPTAAFVVSPALPLIAQQVFFNASASRPSPGRTIVSYAWDFGDGSPGGSGVQTSHIYPAAGVYVVVLVVTDDAGRFATATQTVTVTTGVPVATFTFSPTAPRAGQSVTFDASSSLAASGRSITTYTWSWGDGTPATSSSSPVVSHVFGFAGTFNVTLTVTDNTNVSASTSQAVTITP
jgi:PKD repeat protein